VLVESESELCTRGNNTSHIYLSVRPTSERERERERESGNLLTCIPLFIESPTLSGKSVYGDFV
jgi:hypothetical protein